MDSMINRYTADRKIRSDDAYSPNNEANKRPDRAATVYCQRCREAFPDVPVLLGGIEGSYVVLHIMIIGLTKFAALF
jgi:radical SAM superfamily enzyme YgiQ (UPF0313 family)